MIEPPTNVAVFHTAEQNQNEFFTLGFLDVGSGPIYSNFNSRHTSLACARRSSPVRIAARIPGQQSDSHGNARNFSAYMECGRVYGSITCPHGADCAHIHDTSSNIPGTDGSNLHRRALAKGLARVRLSFTLGRRAGFTVHYRNARIDVFQLHYRNRGKQQTASGFFPVASCRLDSIPAGPDCSVSVDVHSYILAGSIIGNPRTPEGGGRIGLVGSGGNLATKTSRYCSEKFTIAQNAIPTSVWKVRAMHGHSHTPVGGKDNV